MAWAPTMHRGHKLRKARPALPRCARSRAPSTRKVCWRREPNGLCEHPRLALRLYGFSRGVKGVKTIRRTRPSQVVALTVRDRIEPRADEQAAERKGCEQYAAGEYPALFHDKDRRQQNAYGDEPCGKKSL